MVSTSDFKKGTKILFKNAPYMVLEFTHVKPGKGGAFVRTKMKNMITGLVREETFRSGEKFQSPDLEYKDMQYLYPDAALYNFMDQESFEQVALGKDQISDVLNYLKEQTVYTILYFQGRPIAVTPPMFMELEVSQTDPSVRGDTASGKVLNPHSPGLTSAGPCSANKPPLEEGERVIFVLFPGVSDKRKSGWHTCFGRSAPKTHPGQ